MASFSCCFENSTVQSDKQCVSNLITQKALCKSLNNTAGLPKRIPYPSASLELMLPLWGFLCDPGHVPALLAAPKDTWGFLSAAVVLQLEIRWHSIFFRVWYYHSVTATGRLRRRAVHFLTEFQPCYSSDRELVFVDKNQPISVLGRADRKGGFIFSFFNLTFQVVFFHNSNRFFSAYIYNMIC